MAMKFSSVTGLVLLFAVTLLLVHVSARSMQQTHDLPLHVAAASNNDESPTVNPHLDDQKNFIYGAGIGGAAGVGGFMGMPGGGGTGVGAGAFGGFGGAMGFPDGLGDGSSGGSTFRAQVVV